MGNKNECFYVRNVLFEMFYMWDVRRDENHKLPRFTRLNELNVCTCIILCVCVYAGTYEREQHNKIWNLFYI